MTESHWPPGDYLPHRDQPRDEDIGDVPLGGSPGTRRWAARTLRDVPRRRSFIRAETDRLVLTAFRRGSSWTDIARVLGVSRQAVRSRYADGAGSIVPYRSAAAARGALRALTHARQMADQLEE